MPIQSVGGRWANKQSPISFKQQLQALKSSSTKQWSNRIVHRSAENLTSLPDPVLIPQYCCYVGNLGQLLLQFKHAPTMHTLEKWNP
eukprot:scaffold128735_cov40-Attheya_sp.AAC.1